MANHKSAMKRHRQSLQRNLRNGHYRSTVKTLAAKAMAAVEEKSKDAPELLRSAISMVDKVIGKGILPKNRGRRLIGSLGRHLTALKG